MQFVPRREVYHFIRCTFFILFVQKNLDSGTKTEIFGAFQTRLCFDKNVDSCEKQVFIYFRTIFQRFYHSTHQIVDNDLNLYIKGVVRIHVWTETWRSLRLDLKKNLTRQRAGRVAKDKNGSDTDTSENKAALNFIHSILRDCCSEQTRKCYLKANYDLTERLQKS